MKAPGSRLGQPQQAPRQFQVEDPEEQLGSLVAHRHKRREGNADNRASQGELIGQQPLFQVAENQRQ